MGAAQIAAAATVIRPRSTTSAPRRGNNPPKALPDYRARTDKREDREEQRKAGGTTGGQAPTSDSAELHRVKAELIELKKTTNQQLLTEVKFLRGEKTKLEAKLLELQTRPTGGLILAQIVANSDPEGLPLNLGAGTRLLAEAKAYLNKTTV